MPINDRNLPPGTTLVATYRKERSTCAVEAGEDGKTVFRLADGRTFTSPSAAGSAVTGGTACNGWRFWSVEGAEPSANERAARAAPRRPTQPKAPTAPEPAAANNGTVKQIRRVPNQQGVPDGQTKWFCSSCMASFLADGKREPEACPEGHPRLVEDELAPRPATAK